MPKKVLITAFAFMAVVMYAYMAECQVVKDGLVSFWTFNDSDVEGDTVKDILKRRRTVFGGVLADIGTLFAEAAYQGIMFPTDLLMFQKSQVTLKGVIADIDPSFDFDERWIRIAVGSYLRDLGRLGYYLEIYKIFFGVPRQYRIFLLGQNVYQYQLC